MNAWFDRIPRVWFDVGGRRVPAFRSLGILGFHVALVVAILASLRTGLALATVLGLSAVAGLSFFGWGLLRRAVTGRETLVLLEYVWAAYGAVALFAWASGAAVVGLFDVFSVAVPWFLAFGRFGCTAVGCCHGTPAPIGLRYGPAHLLPDRLVGRRLFPVQPIEGIALVAIGLVGMSLVAGPPGRATVWFLASYSVVRFACERFRGDQRPHVWRVSVARIMCLVQTGAAIVASEAWLADGPPGRSAVVGVAVLGGVLFAGLGLMLSQRRNPLLAADHLDEVWDMIRSHAISATPLKVATTTEAMVVAVSPLQPGWHVSFSHPQQSTLEVALNLGGTVVSVTDRVVQSVIGSPWSTPGTIGNERNAQPRKDVTRSQSGNVGTSDRTDEYFAAPSSNRDFQSRAGHLVGSVDQHGGEGISGGS